MFFLFHVYQVFKIYLQFPNCVISRENIIGIKLHNKFNYILATINQGLLVQPEPTLYVTNTAIKSNEIGVFVVYYSE